MSFLDFIFGRPLVLSVVNLRGLREASFVFLIPTYLFVGRLLTVIGIGVTRALFGGGAPEASANSLQAASAGGAVSTWLLLKAFASGCTALTGVEAVSNGVPVFRVPVVSSARRTLTIIVAILIALLIGIAFLTNTFHIMATPPGQAGYQTIGSPIPRLS
jgi:amino acid transporter